jgi:hypothetical protein
MAGLVPAIHAGDIGDIGDIGGYRGDIGISVTLLDCPPLLRHA